MLSAYQQLWYVVVVNIVGVDAEDEILVIVLPDNSTMRVENIDMLIVRNSNTVDVLIVIYIGEAERDKTLIEFVPPFLLETAFQRVLIVVICQGSQDFHG